MKMLSLLPGFGRGQNLTRPQGDPFLNLHREINRLFDDAFRGFGLPETFGHATGPSIDIRETGKGLEVTAELPGVEEKDVDITLANGVLTIRGEKKHEREETEDGYHLMERSYGPFSRSVSLPFDVDDKAVSATFEKGVLRVTLPKSVQAESQVRKIAVRSGK